MTLTYELIGAGERVALETTAPTFGFAVRPDLPIFGAPGVERGETLTFGDRHTSLPILLCAEDVAGVHRLARHLVQLVGSGDVELRATDADGRTRALRCRYDGGLENLELSSCEATHQVVRPKFTTEGLDHPFWVRLEQGSVSTADGAFNPEGSRRKATWLARAGSAPTPPRFTIQGPATSIYVRRGDEAWKWEGSLLVTEWLVVDHSTGTVQLTTNRLGTDNDTGESRLHEINPWHNDLFDLRPGAQRIEIELVGGTSSNFAEAVWEMRELSL